MAVWVVKAGRYGEGEEDAINNSLVGIDFGLRKSVAEFSGRDSLRADLLTLSEYSGDQEKKSPNSASQLWRFANELKPGDAVVLPRKLPKVVAVGTVTGDYRYQPELPFPHVRPVEWVATDIPRSSFDQDLLYSFGGLLTVFQVNRTDAQQRIEQVVRQHRAGEPTPAPVIPNESVPVDLQDVISDSIVERIRQKFTGHRLEYLVEEILKAQGYTTLQTRRGADGGIDVVAGKGEMGFEEPRLCVQVKSGTAPLDLADYNRLQGNVHSFGANHGLLVSLSGFTRPVLNENERSFFEIRLWGAEELTQNLLDTYDNLPTDVRTDIPLVNRKVLAPETDI